MLNADNDEIATSVIKDVMISSLFFNEFRRLS